MVFVAAIPAPILGLVLVGLLIWLTFAFLRGDRLVFGRALYVLVAAQAAVALAALALTADDRISRAACLTGILGAQVSMLVGLALLGSVFAFWVAARQKLAAALRANTSFFLACILLQVAVTVVLLRSALLCTV